MNIRIIFHEDNICNNSYFVTFSTDVIWKNYYIIDIEPGRCGKETEIKRLWKYEN